MFKVSCFLLLSTLIAIHALRIQPSVRWLQRSSLKRKPINIPAPTHTKVVPEPIFRNSNSHKRNIPVLLVNKLKGRKPVLEQQPILSQATNAIDKFKARNPYAIWNATLDGLLEQGVALFSENDKASWENTAKLIGHGMSWKQCRQRWQRYLKDKNVYSRDGEDWTDSELTTMNKLAETQRSRSNSFWTSIGMQLQRNPHQCRDVWERSKETSKGRYTAEEDALILQRVKEHDSSEPGLWTTLGRVLGRPARTVRAHWLEMSAVKDKNSIMWTEEMDEAFLSTHPDTDQPKPFLRVAQCMQTMGYPVTERQCTARWHHHLRWKQLDYRTEDIVWTPEEVSLLNKLQKGGNSWTDIACALRVSPRQCQYKWTEARRGSMKQGPFTPAEDAFIRQKVAAQDGGLSRTQTKGFWMDLEREMGRYHTSIRTRWIRTLFHKIV